MEKNQRDTFEQKKKTFNKRSPQIHHLIFLSISKINAANKFIIE